jgi:hypothetical protein
MAKEKSRPKRWEEACAEARDAYSSVQAAADDLATALGDLKDVQSEYEDWRDNLPENMSESATAEKLDAILEIDIESFVDDPMSNLGDIDDILSVAEGMDLPLGFGRD